MKETFALTPVYTGDVSGVCSALYELGGMVVIHDPSGCNSTYNTHDETRWYHKESLIFITGVTMRDIALGNDKKLIGDILESAEALQPAFIALCTSPLAFLSGTDFEGIVKILEKKTGIPSFFVPVSGMHDYIFGAGCAWECYLKHVAFPNRKSKRSCAVRTDASHPRVNILGLTPLDFTNENTVSSLHAYLKRYGFEAGVTFALETDAESVQKLPEADVNLVISASAVPAAEFLQEHFAQPYVLGVPVGGMRERTAAALRKAAEDRDPCIRAWERKGAENGRTSGEKETESLSVSGLSPKSKKAVLIGEAVCMKSLAAALKEQDPESDYTVVCPLEKSGGILDEAAGDVCVQGELQVKEAARDAQIVIADPLYRPLFPGICFIDLPSLAYSGRIYLDRIPDLISEEWNVFLKDQRNTAELI
ncbi:MAG: nitrogenase component 1 [Lachnospiraceae bacterium]|nr:nitrogenase component 1 [Lachnospiraceae bacterium]